MMGHPLGYWTSAEAERRRRVLAFAAGMLAGAALTAAAWLAGLLAGTTCPPSC